ncbi:uncharacterized protein LOC121366856 [Gigantopelta aegis]|uniref:uncharacterized protein LOC121366856 n=1 Tax=Gigantopelta aegis TaxID=1735272 RepID=UPI001B889C7F|nr:uncharacterized protein LOC121366856 [Gigantopelta aegis]
MVNFCGVFGCGNRAGRDCAFSFFRLPTVRLSQGEQTHELSDERRRVWLSNIGRVDIKPSSYPYFRICSLHFINGKPSALYDKTNPDWAPTLHLGHDKFKLTTGKENSSRHERIIGRTTKRKRTEAAQSLLSLQDVIVEDQSTEVEPSDDTTTKESQTSTTGDQLVSMEEEMRRLTVENIDLKCELASMKLTEEGLKGNDEKVNFMTGLPTHHILMQLLEYISIHQNVTPRSALSGFQQLLLTLMKLRLNVTNVLLGFIFNIDKTTVSRTFLNTIDILHVMLQPLINWPGRDELKKTMPMEFRRYLESKVVVIIDCFEVFIDTPSNLEARALTWSTYKHHNTVKFLIGITPQGTVSFISRAWGGRVSDKFLTEHCGFLNKLLPGDVILADRGFDIADSVGLMMATIKMPAFTKGKTQMPALELEKSRKIAHLRIHVERVIGLLRQKYTLLAETLPIDYLIVKDGKDVTTVDKIAVVCCALINLNGPIVPSD